MRVGYITSATSPSVNEFPLMVTRLEFVTNTLEKPNPKFGSGLQQPSRIFGSFLDDLHLQIKISSKPPQP